LVESRAQKLGKGSDARVVSNRNESEGPRLIIGRTTVFDLDEPLHQRFTEIKQYAWVARCNLFDIAPRNCENLRGAQCANGCRSRMCGDAAHLADDFTRTEPSDRVLDPGLLNHDAEQATRDDINTIGWLILFEQKASAGDGNPPRRVRYGID